ncbi:PWWP domain-containing protein 1 OS=Schizosaccharomyces pombe (strain 972 / ATCC 24843) GN=pdp1 PE=1 SV=1 [Rhizoctonia solani AG-1 IB]|uniref:PWWP domain-containing protein n=3 Tax=Rhizoctonia solani TaxID=456999 RepID=A0A8H2XV80_9AGAM|nr:unnamed protein product [Rhizoctonia solani]CEL62100.1 PWWP domain-containing protein 1 OS=Schizosaccharomyces pombe (strain 972 / ATCC 24843) GN=pdp1 PE=1 SV=1 [Rhizoctonia solani AG-1 IB]
MAQDKKDSDVKYEVGNVVIGKVKGYPPWPGEIINPDEAPTKVKSERPVSKKVTFYCVRFFPVGDHAWLPTKDVSRLLPHEIQAYLAEPSKRKGDLLEGYKIANDPHGWRKEKDALAERERANEAAGISVNDDVDELDNEDEEDEDDVKPKKRKRDTAAASEKKESKVGRAKGKRKTKKSAEQIESEDDEDKASRAEKPTSSKAEKERPAKRAKKDSVAPQPSTGGNAGADDEGDDAAMANDPEAAKVKEWRHKLQRAFLTKTSPQPDEMAGLDAVFKTVENYDKMTVEYLSYSKIGKVMRKIIQLTAIPADEQYHFRQRAQALVTKWQQLITTSEDGSPSANNNTKEKVASSSGKGVNSTNGGKPKSSKASDKDAPAEPEPAANGVQSNGGAEPMKVDS